METSADRLQWALNDQRKQDKLTGIQKKVLAVIERNPGSQDDEHKLLERYWVEVDHWDETKSLYWNLQRSTHSESISRARRKLHELGLITYSPKALKHRTEAFNDHREQYGQDITSTIIGKSGNVTTKLVNGEVITVLND